MKKIGLLGGTFSPIHNGHIALAQNAYKEYGLDEVWFIPSGISYMKKGIDIPDGTHRLNMVTEAIRDYPAFKPNDIELKRKGNTYTLDTLQELRKQYPGEQFYFIVGDDTLFSMDTWYHPEEIMQLCIIIAAVREHANLQDIADKKRELEERYHARILLLSAPANRISSTEIRRRVMSGESIRDCVPAAVERYIRENRLYMAK